jgi:hypothetical protein
MAIIFNQEKSKCGLPLSLLILFIWCLVRCHQAPESGMAVLQKSLDAMVKKEGKTLDNSKLWYQKSGNEELLTYAPLNESSMANIREKAETIAYFIDAQKAIYKLNLEMGNDTLIFEVIHDGVAVGQRKMPMLRKDIIEGPKVDCETINAAIEAHRKLMQAQANACCCAVRTCYPMCKDGVIIGYMMVAFWPIPPCIKVPNDNLFQGKLMVSRTVDALIEQTIPKIK